MRRLCQKAANECEKKCLYNFFIETADNYFNAARDRVFARKEHFFKNSKILFKKFKIFMG